MLKDMSKLRIVGPKSTMSKVINQLHELKILHIEEKEYEGVEIGKPLVAAEQLSLALVRVRAIASQLNIPLKGISRTDKNMNSIVKEIELLTERINNQTSIIKETEEKQKKEEESSNQIKILKTLELTPSDLQEYESLTHLIGYMNTPTEFKKALSEKTSRFLFKSASLGKKEIISLFIDKEHFQSAKTLLGEYEFSAIDLTGIQTERRNGLHKTMIEAQRSLTKLKKENEKILPTYEALLAEELTKAEVPLKFRETEQAFLIWGFVPKESLDEVTDSLKRKTKNRILIEEEPIEKDDKVPISLKNPRPVNSFKFFLDLYSLPKYKEIDPSYFLFLTFPLLFGFMLGDAGYGLVTLVFFWLLKKKMPQFKDFFIILILSSMATIGFGVIFGEYFGFEPYHPLINRNPAHSIDLLMVSAIIVGVLHVNAGLLAGFINEYKAHGFKTAFLEKAGWVFLQAAAALLGVSYLNVWAISPLIGWGVLVLAVIILFLGEGTKGLVEIPSIFGNILSYMRLMAIGLSSVGLALVINDMAGEMFHAGGFMIVAGVLLLIVGHIINIGIGCLGGFLHSLRLHYVELFSKFYKGGGTAFKPFGIKKYN